MTDNDSRGDLPSASSMERYAGCPGSWNLSKGIKEVQTPEMKLWSESGDRIHHWLEDPDFVVLDDPNELEVAELCAFQRESLIQRIFGENAPHVKCIKEDRLWLMEGRKKVFSGKPDDIRIYGDTALIIDFKTNRGDIEESPKNMQLRALTVLLHISEHGVNLRRHHVAIIQPLVNREPLITCYDELDIKQAYHELRAILDAIQNPDAPLVVGDYCKFCPSKFKCPALKSSIEIVATTEVENGISGEDLAKLLTLCKMAAPVIKAINSLGKERLKADITSVPGWTLSKPQSVRSIIDPFAVFKVLSEAGKITRDQFLTDCVSVGIGDLEKALIKFNSIKPKDAKDVVNSVCAPFIELKPKESSLEAL
jgi:hypothetical protein